MSFLFLSLKEYYAQVLTENSLQEYLFLKAKISFLSSAFIHRRAPTSPALSHTEE